MVPSLKDKGRGLDDDAIDKMLNDLALVKRYFEMEVQSIPAPVQGLGDASYFSSLPPRFEDDFANKITLITDGDCEYEDDKDDFSDEDFIGEDNEFFGIYEESYHRILVENGREIEKPANQWYIFLKVGPPEGCDQTTYHLDILKQALGSDADEVYEGSWSDRVLVAILTDEEHDKVSDLNQVRKTQLFNEFVRCM